MFPKQVEILVHAAVQRVFNWNNSVRRPPADNVLKYLAESFTRDCVAGLSEVRFRRLLAECAGFALVGYFSVRRQGGFNYELKIKNFELKRTQRQTLKAKD